MGKDLKGKELGTGLAQRKDGIYTYRYTGKDGKRYEERFKKISEAKKRKNELDYWKNHSVESNTGEVTLNTWYDFWIVNYTIGLKDKTLSNYNCIYNNYIKKEIGTIYLKDINTSMCQKLINQMYQDGYSEQTMLHVKKLLAVLFATAIDDGRVYKSPINRSLKIPKTESKEKIALTESEVEEFLEEGRNSAHFRMMVLGFETGLRVSELAGLFVEDVDLKNNCIHIRRTLNERQFQNKAAFNTPKTEKSLRSCPLSKRARDVLTTQITISQSIYSENEDYKNLLFKTSVGTPVFAGDLRKCMKYVIGRINRKRLKKSEESNTMYEPFPDVHPHVMRYTFATHCVEKNMSPKALQQILGHANIRTTMDIYVQTNPAFLQEEITKIERVNNSAVLKLDNYRKLV